MNDDIERSDRLKLTSAVERLAVAVGSSGEEDLDVDGALLLLHEPQRRELLPHLNGTNFVA